MRSMFSAISTLFASSGEGEIIRAFFSATREWAERLASGPTKAIGWGKKLLHDASELSRRDLLEEEAMLVELNSSTTDSQEGVASFRERRSPEWKGW